MIQKGLFFWEKIECRCQNHRDESKCKVIILPHLPIHRTVGDVG